MKNIFERATRKKLRFETAQGHLSTEQLWDLTLEQLNTVAVALNKKIKESGEESFISSDTKVDADLQLSFDIVKYIIDIKLKEAEIARNRREKKEKRDTLLTLIANKEAQALQEKSIDELMAELNALDE